MVSPRIDTPEPFTLSTGLVMLGVGLAAMVVFVMGLDFPLIRDDRAVLLEQTRLRSLDGLTSILTSHFWAEAKVEGGLYRPVPLLTFLGQFLCGAETPIAFRSVNVILHGVVAAISLLFFRALGLSRGASGLASLLFALHPIHVEVIQEVKGREELLVALFGISAALFFWRGKSWGGWIFSILLSVLALFSKESAVGLVAFVAIVPWYGREKREATISPSRVRILGFAIVSAALFFGVRAAVLGSPLGLDRSMIPRIDNPLAHVGFWERFGDALILWFRSATLLFFPLRLSPDYSLDALGLSTSTFPNPAGIAGLGLLVLAVVISVLPGREGRFRPGVRSVALLFVLTYLPVSNLLVPTGTVLGDRLLYLPSVAWAGAMGVLVTRVSRGGPRWGKVGLSCVLCLGFAFLTVARVGDWKSEEGLFRKALEVVPGSARVQASVAWYDLQRDRLEEAEIHAHRGIEIDPGYGKAHSILGNVYQRRGRGDLAREHFEIVLRCENPVGSDYSNLGASLFLAGEGRFAEAESLFYRALEMDPSLGRARELLSRILIASGRYEEAMGQLRTLLRSDPEDLRGIDALIELFDSVAAAYRSRGEVDRAVGVEAEAKRWREQWRKIEGKRP